MPTAYARFLDALGVPRPVVRVLATRRERAHRRTAGAWRTRAARADVIADRHDRTADGWRGFAHLKGRRRR